MNSKDKLRKNCEAANLLLKIVNVDPKLRKEAKTSDFDLLLKENKKKAIRNFVMWMVILMAVSIFVIAGSVFIFDNLAELSIEVLK